MPLKRVGLVYNPEVPQAKELAGELEGIIRARGYQCWAHSAWDEATIRARWDNLDLVVTLGGDGTILRAARLAAPVGVPILSINFGRLGFLAELSPEEAPDKLSRFLDGECWVEERAMLEARLEGGAVGPALTVAGQEPVADRYIALNDIVLGRGQRSRVVEIHVSVNGEPMSPYRADGVILATATGSTAYSMAAGGPVLYPQSRSMVLTPILPHLVAVRSLVLPPDAEVRIGIITDHEAMFSVDGQIDISVRSGAQVRARIASQSSRLLRCQPPGFFYRTLLERLKLEPES